MTNDHEKFGVYLCCIVERMKCNNYSKAAFEDLLNEGADIDFKSPFDGGNTPLHIAVNRQDIDWTRFLIKAGASSTVLNRNGISAADAAAATNNPKMTIALNRFKKINKKYLAVIDYTKANNEQILELEGTDGVKVLKINNCASLQNVKVLLSSDTFLRGILSSQLFVLILELDYFEDDNNIPELLTKSFKRPLIVLLNSKNLSSMYFNDLTGSFKKVMIDKNSDSKKLESQVTGREKFDFNLVCNLLNLKNGCYGHFNDTFMDLELDIHKKIENYTLIDWAVERSDLLSLKFFKLFDLQFSCKVNTDIVAAAIECGSLEDLKLVLGFPFSKKSYVRRSALNCILNENCNTLLLAAQAGKLEIVKFLLENNCNVNVLNDSGESASDLATKAGNFNIIFELLLSDCPFPKDTNKSLESRGFENNSKIKKLIAARDELHKNIKENRIDKIREFIEENPKIKHAYTTGNRCALTTALDAKQFEVYSILRSEGFSEGIDEEYTQILKTLEDYEKEKIKIINRKYYECSDSNHLQELIARSHLGFGSGQENFRKIRKYFITLNKIPEIQPILKVVANARSLQIVFDFNLDSVCDMDPAQISDYIIVRGRTIYCVGNVLIGANQSDDKVLATLAHELTHLAVHILYDNFGQPYRQQDSVQIERFKAIAETIYHDRSESAIIEDAFDYPDDEIHSELIARVSEICAMFKSEPNKLIRMKNIFKDLFLYFNDTILNDCNANFPVMKSEEKIASLNQLLSVYSDCNLLKWSSNKHEANTDDIFGTNASIFIRTNHPELFLSSFIKSQKEALMFSRSHLFIKADQLLDQKYFEMIKDAFHSEKEPKLFVIQVENLESKDIDPVLKDLGIKSRVVLVAASRPNSSLVFRIEIDLVYNWNDLCDESKKTFMAEEIDFQGKKVALKEIIFNCELLAELPVRDVLEFKNFSIATVNEKLYDSQDFYIDRNFEKVNNGQVISLTASDVCEQILDLKTIIMADVSGKGKSWAAIDLAGKLIERNRTHWVVFFDLKKLTEAFLKDDEILADHDYRNFFAKVLSESELQTKLFQHFFDSKKIIFLIDGYDEISPLYSKFVLELIKTVKNSGNFLLVTTRRYLSGVLMKELEVDEIHLQPFTHSDQKSFLAEFWSRNQKNSKNKESLANDAEALLNMFHKSLGFASLDFFGNPLLIRMLAEIYSDRNPHQPQDVQMNVFLLYEQFFKMKLELLYDKGPLAKSDLIEGIRKINVAGIHQKLALEIFFFKDVVDSLGLPEMPQPAKKTWEIIRRIGLLNACITENNITFEWMHRSFLEYFVADYILKSIIQKTVVAESKILHGMLLDVLLHPQTGEVRKFINDQLESGSIKCDTRALSKKFRKSLSYTADQNILINLLVEGHTAFITFIMKALTEEGIFKLLILADSAGNGALNSTCFQPGNFRKWWPIISKFLNENYQKQLLLFGDDKSFLNLVSTVALCGNEFDLASIVEVVLQLFSTAEVKRILTGQYPGFKYLLLHRALKMKKPNLITGFWEIAVQNPFPSIKDQKEILIAKGRHGQRILCEGISEAITEGIIFVLSTMKSLLTPDEIMACLLDGCDQSLFSTLCLVAANRSLEIFNIVWNFIETSLSHDQQKKVFLLINKDDCNILHCCLWNMGHLVTKRVFEIARSFLTRNEFKDFLRVNKKQSLLHRTFYRFQQFRILSETFREFFDDDELKTILSEIDVYKKTAIATSNRIGNPRNLNLLVEMSKSCFHVDEIFSLFGEGRVQQSLTVLREADDSMSGETLFDVLNARDSVDEDDKKKLPMEVIDSEKVLHVILTFGSVEIISKVIEFMKTKLNSSQIRTLLMEKDFNRCNALGRSLMNNNHCVVDLVWRLYNTVFSPDETRKLLLPDSRPLINIEESQKENIFHLAAATDHLFLITALKFSKTNFSPLEFKAVFDKSNFVSLSHYVAQYCSERTISEYFDFIVDALENEELKLLILKRIPNGMSLLFFMLANDSVDCFRLFWSKISEMLDIQELEKLIFVNSSLGAIPISLFGYDRNLDSLEELKKIVTDLFGKEKLDQRFEPIDYISTNDVEISILQPNPLSIRQFSG